MNTTKVVKLEKAFELKPYNKKELCQFYGVSMHIFNTWLKTIQDEVGKPVGRLYSIAQVQAIVKHLGVPGQVVNEAA